MGRPWEYPRWKRVLMQAAMWVIFGGTLGLAQFVSHERRVSPQADLGPPQVWGRLIIQLPEGWHPEEKGLDQVLMIEGIDPQDPTRVLFMEQRLGQQPAANTEDDTD